MSTTEHDLDAAPVDHRADEEFDGATEFIDDDDLELDPVDVDVPARAQDIDIAEDDDLDVDEYDDLEVAEDDVDGRLGSFDEFLSEAQANHVDVADTDPSYQLPMVVTSTDLDGAGATTSRDSPTIESTSIRTIRMSPGMSSRSCAGRTSTVRPSRPCRTTSRSRPTDSSSAHPSTTRRRCRSRSTCLGCSVASRACGG